LIVRSIQYARSSEEALRTRLAKAQAELLALNEHKQGKKLIEDAASMQAAAEKVLQLSIYTRKCSTHIHPHRASNLRQHRATFATGLDVKRINC
jgi:hypothetical protein